MHSFRLVLAASVLLAASTLAHAQTVIVRNAPIGDTIEVFVNETKSGSGTVAANGIARVPIDLRAATGATELDARVYVDVCSKMRRVYIVNRNIQAPAKADGCERREILGVFWVRQRSTLAI